MTDIMSTDDTKPQSPGDALAAAHKPETPAKRPVGRPSTYDASIIPIILELSRQGKSLVQISAEIDIPRTTMLQWAESGKHPEFTTALARAKELEQAFWEELAQDNIKERQFQSSVWAKSMQARFRNDYTERREVTQDVQVTDNTARNADISKVAHALLTVLQRAEIEALPPVIDGTLAGQDDDEAGTE